MSETASFVDPVFLARFGLSRANVIDYFLHPLNPFRTRANTGNEVLAMQGIAIGTLVQQGLHNSGEPLTPIAAEEEYNNSLTRMTGEQYQLLPPDDPALYALPSNLFAIRHVLRTNPTTVKVLGVYYVVEGVVYKSPAVRSLMKTNVARTLDGLSGACRALSACARYQPSVGYTWVFEDCGDDDDGGDDGDDDTKEGGGGGGDEMDPIDLIQLAKRRKRRKILDNRRPGERTAAEEEGIRAAEAIDQILVSLSKSRVLTKKPPSGASAASGGTKPTKDLAATAAGAANKASSKIPPTKQN